MISTSLCSHGVLLSNAPEGFLVEIHFEDGFIISMEACFSIVMRVEQHYVDVLVQRDLMAARKALKHSLKELDSAEGDRARLQKQVNKLSRTLQVSLSPPLHAPSLADVSCCRWHPLILSTVVVVIKSIHLPFWCTSFADTCRLL